MNWMSEAEAIMRIELGDDPTEEEIDQWYGDYYREHLYPFLPSSQIGREKNEK